MIKFVGNANSKDPSYLTVGEPFYAGSCPGGFGVQSPPCAFLALSGLELGPMLFTPVPEPGTALLALVGVLGLAVARCRAAVSAPWDGKSVLGTHTWYCITLSARLRDKMRPIGVLPRDAEKWHREPGPGRHSTPERSWSPAWRRLLHPLTRRHFGVASAAPGACATPEEPLRRCSS